MSKRKASSKQEKLKLKNITDYMDFFPPKIWKVCKEKAEVDNIEYSFKPYEKAFIKYISEIDFGGNDYQVAMLKKELSNSPLTMRLFREFYNKFFKISQNLFWMMENTDFKNIPSNYIRLPFESICLLLPELVQIGDNFLSKSILVTDYNCDSSMFYNYLENHCIKNCSILPPRRMFHICAIGEDLNDPSTMNYSLFLWDDYTIEEVVELNLKIQNDSKMKENSIAEHFSIITDDFKSKKRNMYNLIINFILYLIHTKDYQENKIYSDYKSQITKKTPKRLRDSILSKIKNECPINDDYFDVGKNIVIKEHIDNQETQEYKSKRSPSTMFWVRGHWREYKHERYKMDNKLQWIKPFFKSRECEQISNKMYIVK